MTTSKIKMLGVLAVFIAPALVAVALYVWFPFNHNGVQVNVGELLEPPLTLTQFSGITSESQPIRKDFFTGKWTLLYLGGNDCDLHCQANVFKARQLRQSLGKDMHRIQTVYLAEAGTTTFFADNPDFRYRDLTVVIAGKNMKKHLENFPKQRLYIVDPHGNVMLHYRPDVASKGVLKDIKRLLRVSRIG